MVARSVTIMAAVPKALQARAFRDGLRHTVKHSGLSPEPR